MASIHFFSGLVTATIFFWFIIIIIINPSLSLQKREDILPGGGSGGIATSGVLSVKLLPLEFAKSRAFKSRLMAGIQSLDRCPIRFLHISKISKSHINRLRSLPIKVGEILEAPDLQLALHRRLLGKNKEVFILTHPPAANLQVDTISKAPPPSVPSVL